MMRYVLEKIQDIYYIFSGYVNLLLSKIGFGLELYRKRASVCAKCSLKEKNHCSVCGCWIPAKVCAEYPIDKNDGKSIGGCPLGKW